MRVRYTQPTRYHIVCPQCTTFLCPPKSVLHTWTQKHAQKGYNCEYSVLLWRNIETYNLIGHWITATINVSYMNTRLVESKWAQTVVVVVDSWVFMGLISSQDAGLWCRFAFTSKNWLRVLAMVWYSDPHWIKFELLYIKVLYKVLSVQCGTLLASWPKSQNGKKSTKILGVGVWPQISNKGIDMCPTPDLVPHE